MRTSARRDSESGTAPHSRFRLRGAGVALVTLLLFGPARLPASAVSPAGATSDHHAALAGIQTPLAVAVGAIVLTVAVLVVVAALTRRSSDGDGLAHLGLANDNDTHGS